MVGIPRFPTRRPYPSGGPSWTGGTRVYPRYGGGVGSSAYVVLPLSHGASLSPKGLRQDWRDSGASAAVWEGLDPLHTSFSHGASLSPKPSTQDRRDSSLWEAFWEWLDRVHTWFSNGAPYPASGSGSRTRGTRVYAPLCGSGYILCIPGFKTGSCRNTGGTRHGGCRQKDPLSCTKTGLVVKKKLSKMQGTTRPLVSVC